MSAVRAIPLPPSLCARAWRVFALAFAGVLVAVALGTAAPAAAQTAAAAVPAASRIVESGTFPSVALGGELAYSVYLPPGFRPDGGPYRVLYLLHGTRGSERDWPRNGGVRETADRLILAGAIRPVIIVMPDGRTSWYVDSAALGGPGDFESAIDRDVVAMIDRAYPTIHGRAGRAIAGLSMGGYGALRFALMHPERYGAVAAISPALWVRVSPDTVPDERYDRVFQGAFGRPFDSRRFVAANPMTILGTMTQPGDAPAIYLAAGNDDYPGVVADAERIHQAFVAAGLRSELHMVDGRHDWGLWSRQLDPLLRFVDRALGELSPTAH